MDETAHGARTTPGALISEAAGTLRPFLVRYAAAWIPLACGYLLVFTVLRDESLALSVWNALLNIAIPFTLGLPVMAVTIVLLPRAGALVQLSIHVALSLAFSFAWLRLLELSGAIRRSLAGEPWRIFSFPEVAMVWQMLQGLTIYFMIVAGSCVIALLVSRSLVRSGLGPPYSSRAASEIREAFGARPSGKTQAVSPSGRIFLKTGGDFAPLDLDDIVCVHGASDYCEIATRRDTRLVRATLANLKERLGSERLLRVHRSHLVNVDMIANVEPRPSGGYTLIMINGDRVPCSRTGAKAIQPFLFA